MALEGMLTAKEVCSIIRTCRESGVTKINYLNLSAEFAKDYEVVSPVKSCKDFLKANEESIRETEDLMSREDKLAMMAIENPSEYEQLIIQGDLKEVD